MKITKKRELRKYEMIKALMDKNLNTDGNMKSLKNKCKDAKIT